MGNQLLSLSQVNLSTGSLMARSTALNKIVFYNKEIKILVLLQRMNYLLCATALENYDLHSGNNYH